jgi:pyruvate dehydrogenase E2 component (dihydrolipoyllysine-residue acetyltransferase)
MTTTAGTAAVAVVGAAAMTTDARRRKPAPGWVFGGALGAFFAALALLAVQVRAGNDPALGEPTPKSVAAADVRPRKVIVKRKVIKRIVVHHPRPAAAATASTRAAPTVSAPATTSAPSAPAPAAPAPAPAPAPLTTQSS